MMSFAISGAKVDTGPGKERNFSVIRATKSLYEEEQQRQ